MDLSQAYQYLEVLDHSICDEDLAIQFYRERADPQLDLWLSRKHALKVIAGARKSRFLRFFEGVIGHLTDDNVRLLKDDYRDSSRELSSEPTVTAKQGSTTPAALDSGVIDLEDATGEDGSDEGSVLTFGTPQTEDEHASSQSIQSNASSACADLSLEESSDDTDIASPDFSVEGDVLGKYFDEYKGWCCESCCSVLVDGLCPVGHEIIVLCEACGAEKLGRECLHCEDLEKDSEDGEETDNIVFDQDDDVWRCIYCGWEVDLESDGDGSCYCLNKKGEKHRIDLSGVPDYEAGEACVSDGEESDDEEPDSEDERFIDDEKPAAMECSANIEEVNDDNVKMAIIDVESSAGPEASATAASSDVEIVEVMDLTT